MYISVTNINMWRETREKRGIFCLRTTSIVRIYNVSYRWMKNVSWWHDHNMENQSFRRKTPTQCQFVCKVRVTSVQMSTGYSTTVTYVQMSTGYSTTVTYVQMSTGYSTTVTYVQMSTGYSTTVTCSDEYRLLNYRDLCSDKYRLLNYRTPSAQF
jgi:hypothetical protein